MAKAMLIMDMPETCYECPFLDEADNCLAMNVYYTDVEVMIEKPTWCPLREVPQKKETKTLNEFLEEKQDEKVVENFVAEEFMKYGYNDCIDEILGGGE